MIYFERLTPVRWPADAHIQTSCTPARAAAEFSWDNPGFRGLLEVTMQAVEQNRPVLHAVLMYVRGPGECLRMESCDGEVAV